MNQPRFWYRATYKDSDGGGRACYVHLTDAEALATKRKHGDRALTKLDDKLQAAFRKMETGFQKPEDGGSGVRVSSTPAPPDGGQVCLL